MARLKNDPGLGDLTEIALKGFLAEKELNSHPDKFAELNPLIEQGKEAAAIVVKYADWLLSTVNPVPPDSEIWVKPDTHPCQRRHADVEASDKSDFDYIDIL